MKGTSCEYCANYTYDEEYESYMCDVNMDARIIVPEMNIRLYVIRCEKKGRIHNKNAYILRISSKITLESMKILCYSMSLGV